MERRAFGGLVAAGIGALAMPARGAWAGESAMRNLMPSEAELASYEAAAGGVLFKDVAPVRRAGCRVLCCGCHN